VTRRLLITFAVAALAACSPEADPLAEEGLRIATERGCVSCHSVDGSRSIGPTWKGLHGSEVALSNGRTVEADDDYLAKSIRDPSADTVEGYEEGLMETAIQPGSVSEEEIRALIAYIKSLN
jgi:cytochrome c oxidase subunit 2